MKDTIYLRDWDGNYQKANDWWDEIRKEIGAPEDSLPAEGDIISLDDGDGGVSYRVTRREWGATVPGGDPKFAGVAVFVDMIPPRSP